MERTPGTRVTYAGKTVRLTDCQLPATTCTDGEFPETPESVAIRAPAPSGGSRDAWKCPAGGRIAGGRGD